VLERANMPKRMRLATFALGLVLAASSCAADKTKWSRGDYVELKSYTSVEFRRGPMKTDPITGELTVAWAGARAPEGYPRIVDCHLYVFDDKNGNGQRDDGEVLQERFSREVSRKVLFADIHVLPSAAIGTLMAQIDLRTEARHRVVTWRLVPD
jgi:hypothetical protein